MAGYFMGMHRDLRMRKVLRASISPAYFISIPTNDKFTKVVRYISYSKLCERWYVLLKIIYPCLKVLCLTDSNLAVMEKNYYYLRITKQFIEKKILYWLSETVPRHIVTIQYMKQVRWRKLWIRVNIKLLYFVFRIYLFCHIYLVEWKEEAYQYWLFCDWLDVICNSSH